MYPTHLRGVPPTPASAPRTPKPPATEGGTAYGPGLAAAEVGCTAVFTVEALDPYDERRRIGGDVVVARLMVGSDVTVEASDARQHRRHLHLHLRAKVCRSEAEAARHNEWHPGARLAVPPGADGGAGRGARVHRVGCRTVRLRRRPGDHHLRAGARLLWQPAPAWRPLVHPLRARQRAQPSGVQGGVPDVRAGVREQRPRRRHLRPHVVRRHPRRLRPPRHARPHTHPWVSLPLPPLVGLRAAAARGGAEPRAVRGDEREDGAGQARQVARHRRPRALEAPSAAMVDGQLVCLSTALSTPTAAHRWPSVHTCQFLSAYKDEAVYNAQAPPPCRWRSCLLPSHDFAARHTLVGGPSSVYVLSQSGGSRAPIDGIACCEVIGGAAWRPPQAFITLRPNGRTPEATEGFAALYIPAVDDCRIPGGSGEGDEEPPASPPKGGKGGKKGGGGGEEGEEGDAGPAFLQLPPCLLLVGGAAADGGYGLLDMYNLEEERWMGDPLEFEPDALTPEPFSHGAACAVPAKKGGGSYDVFVFGGRTAGGVTNQMWAFDVQAMAWREIEPRGRCPTGGRGTR